MLVDTDVLIWHLRGYRQASQRLDRLSELTLSVVSYLELIQGMRNKAELAAVQKMLALRKANVLPLTAHFESVVRMRAHRDCAAIAIRCLNN